MVILLILDYTTEILLKAYHTMFLISRRVITLLFFRKKKKKTNPAYAELVHDLSLTKSALDVAYTNFENVVNPDLIDCYIYEVNSILKRYRFLMQQVQKMQLCERFDSALNVPEPPLVVSLEPSSTKIYSNESKVCSNKLRAQRSIYFSTL